MGKAKLGAVAGITVLLGLLGVFFVMQESPGSGEDLNPSSSEEDNSEGLERSIENNISERYDEADAEIVPDYGYNQGGYLMLDISNNGVISFPIESKDVRLLDLTLENRQQEWSYLSDEYQNAKKFTISVGQRVTINTSIPFPEDGETTTLRLSGPLETEESFVCTGGGQSC